MNKYNKWQAKSALALTVAIFITDSRAH